MVIIMSILSLAMSRIGAVHPNSKVELIRRYSTGIDEFGREQFEYSRLETFAQVQPLGQEVTADKAYLQGRDTRQFWVNGQKGAVTNFLNDNREASTLIVYRGKVWTSQSIEDWGHWIKITATLSEETIDSIEVTHANL